MGISRDSMHKRRHTGARRISIRSKRKFELGRQAANTKLGETKVSEVRTRGGNKKFRALKLDSGNWNWPGEATTRKARILTVVYNATSNELVRTNTLVKGAIVQIDSAPFKAWYQKYYGVHLGKAKKEEEAAATETKDSAAVRNKLNKRNKTRVIEPALAEQFNTGRLYARITSRPGQVGRCDGYILEGEELNFYIRKLNLKKKK
eukprot:TRINITY_DN169_c0_g1_i1.p1 TRINITY_DN169_c0_g1~~TRINITY_DN169_c0_g1_i1.p1  ORF type:complete len:234 (-),score=56.26 TRINITY_DN169_c0_g1_i1:93-707(-)